jgi:phospholipase A1
MNSSGGKSGNHLLSLSFIFLLFVIQLGSSAAFGQQSISDCSKIEDDKERLKCYDEIAGRKPDQSQAEDDAEVKKLEDRSSYLSKLWELDTDKPRNIYYVMPHRSTYLLPVTYNSQPNKEPFQHTAHGNDMLNTEVTFQISMKVKLWQDILGKDMDLWFGYTQKSFWQFYNFADSSPFRETNYEPELLLNFRTDFNFLGMRGRMINLAFNHQSNGQSKPLSRSWNRIMGNVGFEKDNLVLLLKSWYRVPEVKEDDDNHDIEKYMGYGELWGYYFWNDHRFGVMLRNNLRIHGNRGALQLEWSFPLKPIKNISGYVQYFTGFGESLLDYNHSVNRLGIGFVLSDWN